MCLLNTYELFLMFFRWNFNRVQQRISCKPRGNIRWQYFSSIINFSFSPPPSRRLTVISTYFTRNLSRETYFSDYRFKFRIISVVSYAKHRRTFYSGVYSKETYWTTMGKIYTLNLLHNGGINNNLVWLRSSFVDPKTFHIHPCLFFFGSA